MRSMIMLAKITAVVLVGLTMTAYAQNKVEPKTDAVAQKQVDPRLYGQLPNDIIMGDPKAPVTMIEYSSLSCPHCADFQQKNFPEIKSSYIDTGKVKFIHRDFPLDEAALRGAMLAHCAGKDRYYTFLKVLFVKQESWAYQKNFLEVLTNIGKLGGLSGDAIDACMKDKSLETSIVESKLTAANSLDIKATPTFFINGKKHDGGNTNEALKLAIDNHLAALKDVPVKENTAK